MKLMPEDEQAGIAFKLGFCYGAVMTFYNTAQSPDGDMIVNLMDESLGRYFLPISRQDDPLIKFVRLKSEWKAGITASSSLTFICTHPAYQQIIGMGQEAIPLILQDLKTVPDHWFWALKAITGEDPTSLEQKGRIKIMADEWIKWGIRKGYVID